MDQITPFLTGFALSAALIVAIGAQNLFVLRQGIRREHVWPIVLFCAGSDAALILLGVSGVGALLGAAPALSRALSLGGAVFLGWYGIRALRRMATPESMGVGGGGGEGLTRNQALAAAAAFTLLNPHVWLDTVLLMGAAGSAQPAAERPLFVAGAMTASFVWFAALGTGARLLAPLFARPAAWRILDGLVGATMLALAASLALGAAGP